MKGEAEDAKNVLTRENRAILLIREGEEEEERWMSSEIFPLWGCGTTQRVRGDGRGSRADLEFQFGDKRKVGGDLFMIQPFQMCFHRGSIVHFAV